ncbi:MAG: acyl-CoA thioesterase [Longimicrobiales bacterium]
MSSLYHSLWLHQSFRADEWLHFDCHSPQASAGRGLSIASIHDRQGRLVASVTQECLMALTTACTNSRPSPARERSATSAL